MLSKGLLNRANVFFHYLHEQCSCWEQFSGVMWYHCSDALLLLYVNTMQVVHLCGQKWLTSKHRKVSTSTGSQPSLRIQQHLPKSSEKLFLFRLCWENLGYCDIFKEAKVCKHSQFSIYMYYWILLWFFLGGFSRSRVDFLLTCKQNTSA